MKLTFADLQEIRDDEAKLKELTSLVHTTYAQLCALCKLDYSTATQSDDDDEDDDEEELTLSASRELAIVGDMLQLKDISSGKGLVHVSDLDEEDEDFQRMREAIEAAAKRKQDAEDSIEFEGTKSTNNDSTVYGMKDLFRMIRQASHPDKIMRFSANTKEKILQCFHDAKDHYADDNYPAMVLCYVEIFLLRGDPRPINYYIWKYAKERHEQILLNIRYIMQKPYMPAIQSYRQGNTKAAIILFKKYWDSLQDDPLDDMDCFD